jgi:uncharacterized protein YciI
MMGSAMILEAASEEDVWAFLKQDIYSKGNVWQHFEVHPFKIAVQSSNLAKMAGN